MENDTSSYDKPDVLKVEPISLYSPSASYSYNDLPHGRFNMQG